MRSRRSNRSRAHWPTRRGFFCDRRGLLRRAGLRRESRFLGPVSEEELDRLYALSKVALAPITSGSGSSLKVLEALTRKSVLVSTVIGVRGYGIVSGQHGILCDDFSGYPKILRQLRGDAAERQRLAEGGWQFVQAFDCQTVYLAYVNIIRRLMAHGTT